MQQVTCDVHEEEVYQSTGLAQPVAARDLSLLPVERSIGKVEAQEKVVEHVRVHHDLCFVAHSQEYSDIVVLSDVQLSSPYPVLRPQMPWWLHATAYQGTHRAGGSAVGWRREFHPDLRLCNSS